MVRNVHGEVDEEMLRREYNKVRREKLVKKDMQDLLTFDLSLAKLITFYIITLLGKRI